MGQDERDNFIQVSLQHFEQKMRRYSYSLKLIQIFELLRITKTCIWMSVLLTAPEGDLMVYLFMFTDLWVY